MGQHSQGCPVRVNSMMSGQLNRNVAHAIYVSLQAQRKGGHPTLDSLG
jgi:hypothetical protein